MCTILMFIYLANAPDRYVYVYLRTCRDKISTCLYTFLYMYTSIPYTLNTFVHSMLGLRGVEGFMVTSLSAFGRVWEVLRFGL